MFQTIITEKYYQAIEVKVDVVLAEGAFMPEYANAEASGMDIRALEDVTVPIGETAAVSTGVFIALPEGYEIQVRPRSGLAFKHGITVLNTPGTIDSDYRGEIKVCLINHGKSPYEVKKGDKIAQLVLQAVPRAVLVKVNQLGASATGRGEKGFGSTGI